MRLGSNLYNRFLNKLQTIPNFLDGEHDSSPEIRKFDGIDCGRVVMGDERDVALKASNLLHVEQKSADLEP